MQCFTRLLDTLSPQAGEQSSPDEAQRNPGKLAPAVIPAPDWHPGYKNGALLRKSYFVEGVTDSSAA